MDEAGPSTAPSDASPAGDPSLETLDDPTLSQPVDGTVSSGTTCEVVALPLTAPDEDCGASKTIHENCTENETY